MRAFVALLLLTSTAFAQERSAPLSLAQARQLLSAVGVSVGKVFAVDPTPGAHSDRYALTRLDSHQKRPNVFELEIEITPLAK